MTLEELYNELKGILDYFGLKWSDKYLVDVEFRLNEIVFSHAGKHVSIKVRR